MNAQLWSSVCGPPTSLRYLITELSPSPRPCPRPTPALVCSRWYGTQQARGVDALNRSPNLALLCRSRCCWTKKVRVNNSTFLPGLPGHDFVKTCRIERKLGHTWYGRLIITKLLCTFSEEGTIPPKTCWSPPKKQLPE